MSLQELAVSTAVPDSLPDVFTQLQRELFQKNQTTAALAGQLYPDIFPSLKPHQSVNFIDPRQDKQHPLCELALRIQQHTQAKIQLLAIEDGPKPFALLSAKKSGSLPVSIANLNNLFCAADALAATHEPVTVTLNGLRELTGWKNNSYDQDSEPILKPLPDIHVTYQPLNWLSLYKFKPADTAIVSAFLPDHPKWLDPHWNQLTIACKDTQTSIKAIKRSFWGPYHDKTILQKWSIGTLLHAIHYASAQQAIITANRLIEAPLTRFFFLANHAQCVTTPFRRVLNQTN